MIGYQVWRVLCNNLGKSISIMNYFVWYDTWFQWENTDKLKFYEHANTEKNTLDKLNSKWWYMCLEHMRILKMRTSPFIEENILVSGIKLSVTWSLVKVWKCGVFLKLDTDVKIHILSHDSPSTSILFNFEAIVWQGVCSTCWDCIFFSLKQEKYHEM